MLGKTTSGDSDNDIMQMDDFEVSWQDVNELVGVYHTPTI